MDGSQLLLNTVKTRTYPVRWYLLCVLSLHSCIHNAAYSEWGSIAQSAKSVYGWTDSVINMLVNCGSVGTVLGILPVAWLLYMKGKDFMRFAIVASPR